MTRNAVAALLGAAVLTILTACASTVSGHGTTALGRPAQTKFPAAPPSPAAPASAPVSASGSAPVSAPAGSAQPTDLATRLETPPAGSRPWSSAWATTVHPSAQQFVDYVYDASQVSRELDVLTDQGLHDIVHRTWDAANADQADDILVRFADSTGAQSRYLRVTAGQLATPGVMTFAIPGVPTATGYYDTKLDKLGNVRAVAYARVGNVVVELFYYSPGRLRPADAIAWMRAQVALLH